MADLKISQLTGATTPLAGTEVLPVVQSSTTKQVSVANLTAGRSVAMKDLTIESTSGSGLLNITRTGVSGLVVAADGSGPIFWPTTVDNIQIYNKAVTTQIFAFNTSSGNLTAQIGNFVPATAGKGINFTANTGATGMTSQLLNWYEEGAWTPAQGPEVTVVGTYSSSATYTRIGRQVTVKIKLAGSTSIACTAFGRLLTDLPFTSATGDAVGTLWVEGVTESRIALISGSGTTMYATAAFGAPATQVVITATYFV